MSRGRPPLEDIRKHFEKVTEVDERRRTNFTNKFPNVVELACRVLSIPTSSAATERN